MMPPTSSDAKLKRMPLPSGTREFPRNQVENKLVKKIKLNPFQKPPEPSQHYFLRQVSASDYCDAIRPF